MKIILKIIAVVLTLVLNVSQTNAQNVDLVSDKEFQELNKLNPALTGVLNRLRVLGNVSQNLDIGVETRVFKSPNHLGFYATFDDIDNLDRKSFNFSYARDLDISENMQLKLGGNMDYQIKVFHNEKQILTDLNFSDFNGFEYKIDSADINNFSIESKVFDLSLGGSLLYKNLLLGVTLNHFNNPNISIQKNNVQKVNMAVNAQLLGFFNLGQNMVIIPSAIYANQADDAFTSLGLSINYKTVTFNGQYEDLNGYTGYDFGVSASFKKRHLINVSYKTDLISASNGQNSAILSATINSTIFKPKKDLEGILDKLKLLY
jgi:hypothetical protein